VLVKLTTQESYDMKATNLREKRPTKPLDKIGQVALRMTLLQMRRESSIKRLLLLSIDICRPVRSPAYRARCILGHRSCSPRAARLDLPGDVRLDRGDDILP
jgi:hypothetical protein